MAMVKALNPEQKTKIQQHLAYNKWAWTNMGAAFRLKATGKSPAGYATTNIGGVKYVQHVESGTLVSRWKPPSGFRQFLMRAAKYGISFGVGVAIGVGTFKAAKNAIQALVKLQWKAALTNASAAFATYQYAGSIASSYLKLDPTWVGIGTYAGYGWAAKDIFSKGWEAAKEGAKTTGDVLKDIGTGGMRSVKGPSRKKFIEAYKKIAKAKAS